ncbi:MAG: hypothetical protein WD534_10235 [Phycisphaeraceae bacterium]
MLRLLPYLLSIPIALCVFFGIVSFIEDGLGLALGYLVLATILIVMAVLIRLIDRIEDRLIEMQYDTKKKLDHLQSEFDQRKQ